MDPPGFCLDEPDGLTIPFGLFLGGSQLTKLLFQDDPKLTQADAAVESAPKDWSF